MSASENTNVMNEENCATEQQNTLPAFHVRENGVCPGSQAKLMRDWKKKVV